MVSLTLQGNPKSTNNIYRATCRGKFPTTYMTALGKSLKETYQWEAKSQYHGKPLDVPLSMSVRFFFKDKRARDLDNQNKLILDALTGIVYVDDKQINELHLYRDYNPEKPRIELTLSPTTI